MFGPLAVSLALFPSMVRKHAAGALPAGVLRRVVAATAAAVAVPSAAAILLAWAVAPGVIFARQRGLPADRNVPGRDAGIFAGGIAGVLRAGAAADVGDRGGAAGACWSSLVIVAAWHPGGAAIASVLLAGNLALLAGVTWRCVAARPRSGAR